jgi:hypothetical protein
MKKRLGKLPTEPAGWFTKPFMRFLRIEATAGAFLQLTALADGRHVGTIARSMSGIGHDLNQCDLSVSVASEVQWRRPGEGA